MYSSLPINDPSLQNGCNNQYTCLKMFLVLLYRNTEANRNRFMFQWIFANLFQNVFHLNCFKNM